MSSDATACKVPVVASEWKFKWALLVDVPTQILLTTLLSLDQYLRCKLKDYRITHTKEKPFT